VTYTFGDSALASERLRIVAATMEPRARALLGRVGTHPVVRVLDLGCGPGYTTRMLADVFQGAEVTGIDASPGYIAEATTNAASRCAFVLGDVGFEPLPGAPADVIYARYLLSHFSDIARYVELWSRALAPGGSLVLEEPESIRSTDPDFARYEQISAALVHKAGGGVFYAGPYIASSTDPIGVVRTYDDTVAIDVTAGQAAAMFWRNARAWNSDSLQRAGIDVVEVHALAARLQARELDATVGLFDWRQRQTIFTRS
jgi:protein-L-isoaspartate O-methyltransferase